MDDVGDILDHDEPAYVAKISRRLLGEIKEIVFTKGTNLDVVGVFEVGYVGLVVCPNEFLRYLGFDRNDILQKRYEPSSLTLVREVKIHTITKGFDTKAATMSTVLEDELLQIEEGTLVIDSLADLNQTLPTALPELGLTLNALLIPHNEDHDEALLQDGARLDLLLHRKANLETHGVRFRPNPSSVDKTDLLACSILGPSAQSADLGKAQCHELTALEIAAQPFASILVPALTATALMQSCLRTDSASDVGFAGETRSARVGWVGSDGNAAHAAKHVHHRPRRWRHRKRVLHRLFCSTGSSTGKDQPITGMLLELIEKREIRGRESRASY